MEHTLTKNYWQNRYDDQQTGWNIGEPSTPLKEYFDQLENKDLQLLIAGAGNAYEAEYLFKNGFKNIHVVDIARKPLDNLKERCPEFPSANLHEVDFFEFEGQFDMIIEQTFFCAIFPNLRPNYVEKMHQLLKPKGKLVGVLFGVPLNTAHPPYGGSKEEYVPYFEPYFTFKYFEPCTNSIPPRANQELFINLIKNS